MFHIGHFVLLIGLNCVLGLTCSDSEEKCISFVTQKNCGKNEYLEVGPPELGCCPKCGKGLGETKLMNFQYEDIKKNIGILKLMKLALSATGCNDLTSYKKCAPGLKCRNTVCVLDKGMFIHGSYYISYPSLGARTG